MNHRPIIDAGPGLNFLSINKERLLIEVLGPLSTPGDRARRGAPQGPTRWALPRRRSGLAKADTQVGADTPR